MTPQVPPPPLELAQVHEGLRVRYYLSLALQPRKSRDLTVDIQTHTVVFSSVWSRMFQAEGTANTNARRNGKEAGSWGAVSKRRGGRKGSAGVGRARARRTLEAVSIPQGKPSVTLVPVWKMDSSMNEEGQ